MALFWIAAFVAGLVAYIAYDTYRKSRYWSQKGIPSLKPAPLFGSLLTKIRTGQREFDLKWTEKLGPIFGYFEGPSPYIVTSDLEMLRHIMVKDFSHFANRRDFGVKGPIMELNVAALKDQHWKDVRSVLLPAFTSGKLKQMNNLFKECCDDLLGRLDQLAIGDEEFSAKDLYGRLALDVIATTFFATKVNSQKDPNSNFAKNAKKVFEFSFVALPAFLSMIFPKVKLVMKFFGMQTFNKVAMEFFVTHTAQIIQMRKETKQNRRDFLQLMLNSMKSDNIMTDTKPTQTLTRVHSEAEPDVASAAMILSGTRDKPISQSNYKLSLEELVAQSVICFLAGYDTTASTLTFMTYCLATHPDIQERLRKEIRTVLADKDVIEYDDLAEMTYLDQCVNETLRLYPPLSRIERECGVEWTYEGVTYEKGTLVAIPMFTIHRNPEYWPEPEMYNPDRFSKEERANIKPYTFLTFGQGPRNCIGMRFALYEIKMVMASILKKYRFVQSPKTQVPLVLKDESVGLVTPEKGIWIAKINKLPTACVGSAFPSIDRAATAVLGLIAYLIYDAFRKRSYWPDKGIPTLPGLPVVGNVFQQGFFATKPGEETFDLAMTKKLGKIFGYFDGPTPVVMISELEMLKNIMVKDFGHFVNRREFGISGPVMELNVLDLRDQKWKDVRSVLVPSFSSGKIKQMNSLVKECCDVLLTKMGEYAQSGEDCPVKELYGRLTMDVIATTFFGTKVNSQNDPNDGFVQHAKSVFKVSQFEPAIMILTVFPKLRFLFQAFKYQTFPKDDIDFFVKNTEEIVKLRIGSKQVRKDFLQLMLNSLRSMKDTQSGKETQTVVRNDGAQEADVASSGLTLGEKPLTSSNYKLTNEELVAQAIIFFLAGYETTATTLTYLTYCLTIHQDVQEKLRKEIFAVLGEKDNVEYDDLAELHYLDQCINETLRLYPPITRTERVCNQDWEYNGVKYEKGTIVAIPILAITRDPDYWPNPEQYDPDRFSPENKQNVAPYSFMPFGQGPRNCIGMRFAYYEIKVVMAHLLRKYRFVKCDRTQIPLVVKDEAGILGTEKGVWSRIEKL
ncbi:uncharacterized protein LOC129596817 [Paramacrobiotus metropolitanus]|uniref:uncharacterized protein LOC129596817 n=1 Tax=Paramacrobiotus metropolitanus TaxID=2943436 RepID=UPI002446525A|nr:uncharacterized protein LOC129596817 [Paramacrobiotus metropolitanus]